MSLVVSSVNFEALHPQDLQLMPVGARPNMCEDTVGIVARRDGQALAIAVMDNWSFNSCLIHIWIDNPIVLRHGFADEVFRFVFDSGREKILGLTPANNRKALKFIKHLGFKELYRIKDGYKQGVDFVLTEMDKRKYKATRR